MSFKEKQILRSYSIVIPRKSLIKYYGWLYLIQIVWGHLNKTFSEFDWFSILEDLSLKDNNNWIDKWMKLDLLTSSIIYYKISARADGGPRSRLRTLDVSSRPPIDTSGNFPAHVSAESPLNISPNLSEVISEVSEP